jgi:glycosyltransferase involved in cell wall biosynthesis
MRRLITETCAKSHYDVIHTHLIRMAQYTAFAGHIPKTLDLTDAGSLYLRRFLAHEKNPFKKFLLKIELDRISRYENILEKYDVCFVCAKPDEKAVRKAAPAANLAILPNSVDLDYFSSNGSVTYDQAGIVFTGNLTYYPNIDAVFFFVEEIFPLIKKALPAAKFYIVGQAPPAKVRALASDDVIVTGFVEDIRLYYLRSAVSVSPIRFGAGTLNKILEPLALGVPVVATSLAIQGLDLTVGKDVLTADHPQGFANEVVRVMKDSALRERLGKEGLATVRRLYNLDAIASSLENCYQEMAMKSHKVRRQEYWSPVE